LKILHGNGNAWVDYQEGRGRERKKETQHNTNKSLSKSDQRRVREERHQKFSIRAEQHPDRFHERQQKKRHTRLEGRTT
jgi:hypothetical protein